MALVQAKSGSVETDCSTRITIWSIASCHSAIACVQGPGRGFLEHRYSLDDSAAHQNFPITLASSLPQSFCTSKTFSMPHVV